MRRVFVIHGPNLNLLGTREPAIYGVSTLEAINRQLLQEAQALGLELRIMQSNCEGEIVSAIHAAAEGTDMLIINAGAYTHTSLAIADAIHGVRLPAIEVHLSNIYAREAFRQHSYLSRVCVGQICGFGASSYLLALQAAHRLLSAASPEEGGE